MKSKSNLEIHRFEFGFSLLVFTHLRFTPMSELAHNTSSYVGLVNRVGRRLEGLLTATKKKFMQNNCLLKVQNLCASKIKKKIII